MCQFFQELLLTSPEQMILFEDVISGRIFFGMNETEELRLSGRLLSLEGNKVICNLS